MGRILARGAGASSKVTRSATRSSAIANPTAGCIGSPGGGQSGPRERSGDERAIVY